MVATQAAVAEKAVSAGNMAGAGVMGEVENEGMRQAVAAKTVGVKGAATAKATATTTKAIGVKSAATAKAVGVKGAAAAGKGGGLFSVAKSSAIFTGNGLALGTWMPVILGVVGAVVAYRCLKGKVAGNIDQSETDIEIQEALG